MISVIEFVFGSRGLGCLVGKLRGPDSDGEAYRRQALGLGHSINRI